MKSRLIVLGIIVLSLWMCLSSAEGDIVFPKNTGGRDLLGPSKADYISECIDESCSREEVLEIQLWDETVQEVIEVIPG